MVQVHSLSDFFVDLVEMIISFEKRASDLLFLLKAGSFLDFDAVIQDCEGIIENGNNGGFLIRFGKKYTHSLTAISVYAFLKNIYVYF